MRPRRVIRTSAEGGNSVNTRATQPFAVFVCNVRRPYLIAHCGTFYSSPAPHLLKRHQDFRCSGRHTAADGIVLLLGSGAQQVHLLLCYVSQSRGDALPVGFFLLLCGLVGIHALDSGLDEY